MSRDRGQGALLGLAIGDALGAPTQFATRDSIAVRYGVLEGFCAASDLAASDLAASDLAASDLAASDLAASDLAVLGSNHGGRRAPATVSAQTRQAVMLSRLLLSGTGRVDQRRYADELLRLGQADPSTRKALNLMAQGIPADQIGRWGDTSSVVTRVAPVGIVWSIRPLSRLVAAVAHAGQLTHNTGTAIAGAAAVAAAVSAGIESATMYVALQTSVEAARLGTRHGHYLPGADVAARIRWAIGLVRGLPYEEALDLVYRLVGTGCATQEAVPAALAICALFPDDPWRVCRYAASLGGDSRTVAAIAGAVAGACRGAAAFPMEVRDQLRAANPDLDLDGLADDLLELRASSGDIAVPNHDVNST